MHPQFTGEMARLRSEEIARATSPTRQPKATPAGFLFSVSPRHAARARHADSRVRERFGLALIRIGTRVAGPAHLPGTYPTR